MIIDLGILYKKYYKKIIDNKSFIVARDENCNVITSDLTTDVKTAQRLLETLTNCENCIDSMNCTNSKYLAECINCHNCVLCMDDTDKTNCKPLLNRG